MAREAMPVDWASAQMNRASAYLERIRGDRADNVETAIAGHDAALEVRTREAMPVEWADVQLNRANAYAERIRGDRAGNLENDPAAGRSAACHERLGSSGKGIKRRALDGRPFDRPGPQPSRDRTGSRGGLSHRPASDVRGSQERRCVGGSQGARGRPRPPTGHCLAPEHCT